MVAAGDRFAVTRSTREMTFGPSHLRSRLPHRCPQPICTHGNPHRHWNEDIMRDKHTLPSSNTTGGSAGRGEIGLSHGDHRP